MIILAHRGNMEGPDRLGENRCEIIARALARGFGVETDIRRWVDGRLYISHDRQAGGAAETAELHASLWATYPDCLIALNIKERGHERATLDLLQRHRLLDQAFMFDMELIEPLPGEIARELRSLNPLARLASRISDRGETAQKALSLPGEYIWLDEMDSPWASAAVIQKLHDAGRVVIGVSRDLHGERPEACYRRWDEFAEWGVEGICTDWPLLAADRLGQSVRVA